MTTIINTPPAGQDNSDSGVGIMVAVIVIGLLGLGFVLYGLPAIKQMVSVGTPQINVPSKIDVNVVIPKQ